MNTRAKIAAAFALTSTLTASAFLAARRPAPAAPPPVAAATAATAAPARAASLPPRRWTVGESFVYEITASRAVSAGAGQAFNAALTARFAVTVAARDDKGLTLRAELRDPRFASAAAGDRAVTAALVAPFYARALPSGEILSFAFAKGTPAEAAGLLEDLLAGLEVVSPGAPLPLWRVKERDATGEYEAVYARTAGGVHKSKEAYLRARGAGGFTALPGVYTVTSSIDITLDASGWPRAVAGDESLDIDVLTSRFTSKGQTRARLLTVEMRPDLAGEPDRSALSSDEESAAAGFEGARRDAEENLIAGRSFKDIAATFHAPEVQKRNDAMVAMGALFRHDPRAAAEAREAVLHGGLDGEQVARTTAALGAAGTPEAQRALGEIIQSPDADSEKALHAVVALGATDHPLPENDEVLRKAMASGVDDVASAAALAAGSTIRTHNTEGSADTGEAVAGLASSLAGAQSTEATRTYLLALGNSGDPRALSAIEPYLSSPDVDLRVAAVTALRHIPGDRADADILAAMADTSYLVRRAAVDTIAFRPGASLVEAAEGLLRKDPEESVRVAVLSAIYPRHEAVTSVMESIAWAADNDPARKVREAAKQFLNLED